MKKNFTKTYKSLKNFQNALKRNSKLNTSFIHSEEGKTSAEFLTIVGLGLATVSYCTFKGGKSGGLIGGPLGAKIGAGIGAAIGLAATATATRFYYTMKMNKDGSITVNYTRI